MLQGTLLKIFWHSMSKNLNQRWLDYLIFGLSIFLIFCLLFESHIELPNLVAWLGRWHPLVLHFPIVLLLVAIFLGLTKKNVPRLLLITATLSALITAISGFMLGLESTNKGELLQWHQWLGSGVAFLAVLWYWLSNLSLEKTMLAKALQVGLLILIGFAGHYGGMVTHGEDFLALPNKGNALDEIPENPEIYAHIVQPILDNKCVSCHNPNKEKGELLLTDYSSLLNGGENGATIDFSNLEESEFLKRLHLPLTDEDHMPPEGKQQLNSNEIQILERWVALGATDTLKLSHLNGSEPLVGLVKALMEPDPEERWEGLPKLSDEEIIKYSSDYISIFRVSGSSNALNVKVYSPPNYDATVVTNLQPLAKNIVQLDLSELPLGDLEMDFVALCNNLEWLEIDKTPITDAQLDKIKGLKQMATLKAYGTKITDKSITVLEEFQNLKSVYVSQTEISKTAIDSYAKTHPNVKIDEGINAAIEAFFTVPKDTVTEPEKPEVIK